MSESDGEHAARSVALEQAYVHEVYEQCAERTTQSRHWPRVYQFLQELEPGALVCDIGCGNGKYLSVNHSVFKIGVDRCKRFTDIAREKENEVLICDNLALPFREESFDAVLSIAVVHHFATTERRVHALKELARVLRIGGRLVISVWAMEQKHRKFESQDVLIPWPKSYCMSGASDGAKRSSASDGNEKRDDNAAQKHTSSSKKNSQRKCKSKSYWIDPIFSLSPSTSSLSSPNETCYSCFRRALQKLARSRRGGGAWFPGSWQGGAKSRRHCDSEDTTDVDELPIELRRVEVTHTLTMTNKHSADTLSIKSKSLGDILEIERLDLVRSRSSIPGFCSTSELVLDERSVSSSSSGSKPRLVKQRPCAEETVAPGNPEDTAIGNLIRDPPSFSRESPRRRNVPLKQSSMNEELMSAERLAEKERVRRNIMKQASLNEELICKWRTFETLKDTISPVNASRRFQLLKNELTSKLKRSTTNIEKVSSMSIKNGFVRMLQGWKSGENEPAPVATETTATPAKPADSKAQPVAVKRSIEAVERRLSREDGSDSSKDSSLQSDTSVDSEDSFASVIYVPKPDAAAPAPPAAPAASEAPAAPRPAALQLAATSAPPSPRVKQPPENGPSSRYKVIGASPLLKQQPPVNASARLDETTKTGSAEALGNTPQNTSSRGLCPVPEPPSEPDAAEPDTAPLIRAFNDVSRTREPAVASEDDNRRARLNQIKELLIAKPGFATRSRPSFPLVRRASTAASGRLETVTRILPRLLSLELFNPETDDLDSDSSGVSSPESVGSVISVTSDEKYIARREAEERKNGARHEEAARSGGDDATERTRETESAREDEPAGAGAATLEDSSASPNPAREGSASFETEAGEATRDVPKNNDPVLDAIRPASRLLLESGKTISAQSMKLLEAAANVASSLEDAVGAAIQRNGPTSAPERQHSRIAQTRRNDDAWSSARAHHDRKSVDLTGRADESSSDLIRDISRYCQNSSFDIFGVHPESRTASSGTADDNPAEPDAAACWGDCDRAPKGTSWIVNEAYDEPGKHTVQSEPRPEVREDHSVPQPNCDKSRRESKYEVQLEDAALIRLNPQPGETARSNFDEPGSYSNFAYDGKETIVTSGDELRNALGPQPGVDQERRACPKPSPRNDTPTDDTYDDILDFVVVSKTGECEDELKAAGGKWRASQDGLSAGSSDVGDSLMENTTASPSDGSQAECSTARLFTGSTASLVSNLNAENDRRTTAERHSGLQERGRSLDETSSEARRRNRPVAARRGAPDSLSNASSQESLPSDRGGGSITYHQYYHVFREGELDQLINKYVQNLHIISSYYDHASWCVVAEKVQVWTI